MHTIATGPPSGHIDLMTHIDLGAAGHIGHAHTTI